MKRTLGMLIVLALLPLGVYAQPVVINEINYNADGSFDAGEWIELYNPGPGSVDLSNWTLKDQNDANAFTLLAGNTLPAGGYLVVAEDLTLFGAVHPGVGNVIGSFGTGAAPFGFGNAGDQVRLYNAADALVDSVKYKDGGAWPREADGDGSTLALADAGADNAEAENWGASVELGGTPGAANGNTLPYVRIDTPEEGTEFTNVASIAIDGRVADLQGAPAGVTLEAENTADDNLIPLGTATLNGGTYTLTWANPPAGEFKIQATATDGSGATSKSPNTLIRVFSTDPCDVPAPNLVITEINYNAPPELDTGDWVELYNPNDDPVPLRDWVLRDEQIDDPFVIPDVTIPALSYFVFVRDSAEFRTAHTLNGYAGELSFGLSGNDQVRLFTPNGCMIDLVDYDNEDPWPTAPDGGGATLALRSLNADNADPASWGASRDPGGTPGNTNAADLPVELTGFFAEPDGPDAVLLTWATATETENAGFHIEMNPTVKTRHSASPAEGAWQTIGFVEGAGTTREARSYRYTVAHLAPGTYAFRLKQIDFDGTFAYSPVVQVQLGLPGAFSFTRVYPNPFRDRTRFTFAVLKAQPVDVVLYDVLGRPVATVFDGWAEAETPQTLFIDGQPLPNGTYFLRLTGDGFSQMQPLVIQR